MLPLVEEVKATRDNIISFGGYNHNLNCGENEFYDEMNLTSDNYPVLSVRRKRGPSKEILGATPNGLYAKNGLITVCGTHLFFNGEIIRQVSDTKKVMCGMGAYVLIWPDKIIFNTNDMTFMDMGEKFETSGTVKYTMCKLDGTDINPLTSEPTISNSEPANVTELMYWIDTSNPFSMLKQYKNGAWKEIGTEIYWIDTTQYPHVLKVWNDSERQWSAVATSYTKIESKGVGEKFKLYDVVSISGVEGSCADTLNKDMAIWAKEDDYIVVTALLNNVSSQTNKVTIERKIPDMDFVCESENRVWGCSSEKHEIYCCKQGDPTNWYSYLGTASDSYAATVGSDGDFTGACAHGGQVLFFKENCIHKVYGNYPSNYQIQMIKCRGVQKGSEASLCVVNEVLYYKTRDCICAYDGGLPVSVSEALGKEKYNNASAGALGGKYYISMEGEDGKYRLFVYDTDKNVWHREDDEKAKYWTCHDGNLYYLADSKVKCIGNSEDSAEDMVSWMAVTGIIGLYQVDKKYISRIALRLSMELGAEMYVDVEYDSSEKWEELVHLESKYEENKRDTPSFVKMRSYEVPIIPRRCDHMRLRLRGKGNLKLFSISKVNEQGGY